MEKRRGTEKEDQLFQRRRRKRQMFSDPFLDFSSRAMEFISQNLITIIVIFFIVIAVTFGVWAVRESFSKKVERDWRRFNQAIAMLFAQDQQNLKQAVRIFEEIRSDDVRKFSDIFRSWAYFRMGKPENALSILEKLHTNVQNRQLEKVVDVMRFNILAYLGRCSDAVGVWNEIEENREPLPIPASTFWYALKCADHFPDGATKIVAQLRTSQFLAQFTDPGVARILFSLVKLWEIDRNFFKSKSSPTKTQKKTIEKK